MYPDKQVSMIPIMEITIDETKNTRGRIDPSSCFELAKSIAAQGQLVPGIVRYVNGELILVSGYRRYKACRIAEQTHYKAEVRHDMTDQEALDLNFIENMNRCDLSFMQEAKALEIYYGLGIDEDEIGKRFGKSRSWVRDRTALLRMPKEVQEAAADNKLTLPNIRDLFTIKDAEKCVEALKDLLVKKRRGELAKVQRVKPKRYLTQKRTRNSKNAKALLLYLFYKKVPVGLYTRVLGWINGEVSDLELAGEIETIFPEVDLDLPTTGFPCSEDEVENPYK